METGRTVILMNLESIYESLYDILNQVMCTITYRASYRCYDISIMQYYVHVGNTRYVDLGLQSHRVKCRVHDDFK